MGIKGENKHNFTKAGTFEPGIASREGGHIYENISGTLRANPGDNQMTLFAVYGADMYNQDIFEEVQPTLGINCGMSSGRNGVIERSLKNMSTPIYIKVYAADYIANNELQIVKAEKTARVKIEPNRVGDEIISWVVDNEGNPMIEKTATVHEGQSVLTKIDDNGNPISDKHGHINQWVADNAVVARKYELIDGNIGKPISGIQVFAITKEPLTLINGNEETKLSAGSFINITNPDDMYGISPRDFNDTYRIIEE